MLFKELAEKQGLEREKEWERRSFKISSLIEAQRKKYLVEKQPGISCLVFKVYREKRWERGRRIEAWINTSALLVLLHDIDLHHHSLDSPRLL